MEFDEEEDIMDELVKERDKLSYKHTFALDTFVGYPLFIAIFALMFVMIGVDLWNVPEAIQTQLSMVVLAIYLLCGAAGFVLWIYADNVKKGMSRGKTVVKAHLLFMEPNSTNVRGAYEHTLVIESTPQVNAIAPVKNIIDDVLTDLKQETFDEIMKNIEERLPKLPDGKKYKVVRYHFPNTPFPDLILKDGRYVKGTHGTYVNRSLLMIVHEDFAEPTETFDYSPSEITTFYANYEDEHPCHLGTICLWEFNPLLQEWVCTPGLLPEHRNNMQQVRPDDKVREYVEIVELLRLIPTTAGANIRVQSMLESLQELVKQGQIGRAVDTGIDAMNPGFKKSNFLSDMWNQYRFWIIVVFVVIALSIIWIFFGGGFGG